MKPCEELPSHEDDEARIEYDVLPTEELKRRIDAARTLRGLDQADLAELVHADGLGKHDVGRLERGKLPMTRALRDSLCRHLDVPAWWFTSESVKFPEELPESLEYRIARIEAAILGDDDLDKARQAIRTLTEAADPDAPGEEGTAPPSPEVLDPPSRAEGSGLPPA